MAKQQLTKESVKETVKQYDRVKVNVKKAFDELGAFYMELDRMFEDNDTVHYWWNKVSDELKLGDSIDWYDLEPPRACIRDDNEISSIAVHGKYVCADVTNCMVYDGESTRAAVPLEIVINPKILSDTIKKYLKQAELEQDKYDVDGEKVIGRIARKFIDKYGKRLESDDLWDKFTELAESMEKYWPDYQIHISDVYIKECADGLDHLFVIYNDRYDNSGVYVSGLTE